jgi:hypothetical protein
MAESNFGIMELLQKLLKERGGAISEKEMGIMSGRKKGATDTGKTGSGYESWLEKNRFDRDKTSNYTPNEMQYLDPLANTQAYNNATAPALREMEAQRRSALASRGFNFETDRGATDRGAVSNKELQNFKIASQYVDDGALSGWLTQKMPALRQMGVGNFDRNLPPNELRNVIDAISTGRFGGVSDNEYEFMVDGMSEGYSFDSQPTEQAIARMRQQQGITANLGGGMDQGAVSDIDARFASRLGAMSDREQAEIISATKGMTTDEQIDNFKRQFLQGRISPYELEMQSNLGF